MSFSALLLPGITLHALAAHQLWYVEPCVHRMSSLTGHCFDIDGDWDTVIDELAQAGMDPIAVPMSLSCSTAISCAPWTCGAPGACPQSQSCACVSHLQALWPHSSPQLARACPQLQEIDLGWCKYGDRVSQPSSHLIVPAAAWMPPCVLRSSRGTVLVWSSSFSLPSGQHALAPRGTPHHAWAGPIAIGASPRSRCTRASFSSSTCWALGALQPPRSLIYWKYAHNGALELADLFSAALPCACWTSRSVARFQTSTSHSGGGNFPTSTSRRASRDMLAADAMVAADTEKPEAVWFGLFGD